MAAALALGLGFLLGLPGLHLLRPQLLSDGGPIESFSGCVLLISLFCLGLRLRVPLEWRAWELPLRLGTVATTATIAMAAAAAHLMFNLTVSQAILVGLIVAPTDCLLASDLVQTESDQDGAPFILSAESALNNALMPTLVAALLPLMGLDNTDTSNLITSWHAAVWAICAGVAAGWLTGKCIARAIVRLDPDRQAEFLEAAMVFAAAALAYGLAVTLRGDGFVAVLSAGVALSHGGRWGRALRNRPLMPGAMKVASLIERAAWLGVLILLGALIATVELRTSALIFAGLLLLVVRPLAVRLGAGRLAVPEHQWRSIGWFAPRGAATLYCLSFALDHGVGVPFSHQLATLALIVLVSSLLAGGFAGLSIGRASPGALGT